MRTVTPPVAFAVLLRAFFLCMLAGVFSCAHAQAELIRGSFLFANKTGGATPVPASGYDITVNGLRGSYTFNLKITSAIGTPLWRNNNGGIGVNSADDARNMIDYNGEDLTFDLSVTTMPGSAAASLSKLTFNNVYLRSANHRTDSGSFGNFQNQTGPGNPGSPATYLWQDGNAGSDFPGMTSARFPSFDLRLMNQAPVARFTHTYVSGRYAFRQLDVSVIANPEPSSFLLGIVAAGLFLVRCLIKRGKQRILTGTSAG